MEIYNLYNFLQSNRNGEKIKLPGYNCCQQDHPEQW